MMVDPSSVKKAYENAKLEKIIKERDKLIREIRRYENGKIPKKDYMVDPSPEVAYRMNNMYLAELCYLIVEKDKENDGY